MDMLFLTGQSGVCRPPFDSSEGYIKMRNSLVKMGLDLVTATQHVNENSEERVIMAVCTPHLCVTPSTLYMLYKTNFFTI